MRLLRCGGSRLPMVTALAGAWLIPGAPAMESQALRSQPPSPAQRTLSPTSPFQHVRRRPVHRRPRRRSVRRPARLDPALPAASSPLCDYIDFAVEASRTAHLVETDGGAPVAERANLGTLSLPIAGIALPPGASVRARLRPPAEPGYLCVTLATAPRNYLKRQSYRVRIDGVEVTRAAEADPGGGITRSFFVPLAPGEGRAVVEIAAGGESEAPVTVAMLRAYRRLPALNSPASRPDPRFILGVALLSRQGGGYLIDAAEQRALYSSLPNHPLIIRQTAVLYNFCIRTGPENAAEINRLAAIALDTGIPLRIAFQVHWGGIPKGVSDGAGGLFTDMPYQQITWDPDDKVAEPGLDAFMGDRYDVRFGLTAPNVWGDTPWLSFNHPRLNQLRQLRLTQALMAWRDTREKAAASGRAFLLPGQLSTGDETVYWAKGVDDRRYTELNGGKPRAHLQADFNPFTVTDALMDHVFLDPKAGLTYAARWWLHQNLGRQQQRLIGWMFDSLPAEPVRLGTNMPYAADLLRRNLYTEPYAMPLFPMKELSSSHPGLEEGCVRNGRSGGEYWSGATMLPWLLKERERGRTALPNLECTGAASDDELAGCLLAAYATGARFATLYNHHKRPGGGSIAAVLHRFARALDTPESAAAELRAASAEGPVRRLSGQFAAGPAAFGVNRITIRFDSPPAAPLPVRITLRNSDRARPASVAVTSAMEPAGATVLLPTLFPLAPGRNYVVSIESLGAPLPGGARAEVTADLTLERGRSLAIQEWQDAADILESLRAYHARVPQSRYAAESLAEAQSLFAAARPADAYRAAVRAEQLSLPAHFDLPAPGGRLAPYWINIRCAGGPVRATINVYTDSVASVTLRSEIAQTVTLHWGTFDTAARLSPGVSAEITLETAPKRPARRMRTHPPKVRRNL